MKSVHTVFILLLLLAFIGSSVFIGLRGCGYYTASQEDRPYHPDYETLKPSGIEGHGYGILGSALIIFGVALYSSRKRARALKYWGKIKYFLEFHIFLCLAGPMLVLYHTTFKFGGLVAVSFWSMTAVVLSGIAGRYLYTQIPRGIHGNELSAAELEKENQSLAQTLRETYGVDAGALQSIDALAIPPGTPEQMTWGKILSFFIIKGIARRRQLHRALRATAAVHPDTARRLRKVALRRVVLSRRIAFLRRFRELFQYWHVVHLPFTIVMFLILLVHVAVALVFGYFWIF